MDGDWQYVLGVNRRCQHLALYSLRGCRKRDYPPSFNYNTNWWTENRTVEDYFARVSVVLEQGEAVRKILLLHPCTTLWSWLGVNPYGNPVRNLERDIPKLDQYGDSFNGMIEFLERAHLDCDLGDESLMESIGSASKDGFWMGKVLYSAIVLPPVDTLLEGTVEKLLEYMELGGKVYAIGPLPFLVEGGKKTGQHFQDFLTHENLVLSEGLEELTERLEPYRTIGIKDEKERECEDVLYQLRKAEEGYYLFLVNNNREKAVSVTVKLPFLASVSELHLMEGRVTSCGSIFRTGEGTEFFVRLGRTGSAAFFLIPGKVFRFSGRRQYRLNWPNVLPLDRCCYSLDGEEYSQPGEVWQTQMEIRDRLSMRQIQVNGQEQRYKWAFRKYEQDNHQVSLKFSFFAESGWKGVYLAAEQIRQFSVILNGYPVEVKPEGWFLDREFEMIKLPSIRKGENELVLTCAYKCGTELENIYLVGDFGVSEERRLTKLPGRLAPGDWTRQVYLRLPKVEAVCVNIWVGKKKQPILWNYEAEIRIGEWLEPGKNQIWVEVVGSPRNTMGPFHLREEPHNTHDRCFCPDREEYNENYLLVPYGLMGNVEIVEFR